MADPFRERWTRVEGRLKSMRHARDEVVEEFKRFRNEAREGFRERKDRIFQARITGRLDKAIKEKAKELGAPASRLVRAILEDFLFRDERGLSAEEEFRSANAFQEVVLVRPTTCESCDTEIAAGDKAFSPFPQLHSRSVRFFCLSCSLGAVNKKK